jgi:hypothetical protein
MVGWLAASSCFSSRINQVNFAWLDGLSASGADFVSRLPV